MFSCGNARDGRLGVSLSAVGFIASPVKVDAFEVKLKVPV